MSHDNQQCIKHCEEAVNGRLIIAEKVLEHPCAFKVGLNVVAVVLFVHLQCTNWLRFLFVVRIIHPFISKKYLSLQHSLQSGELYWQNQLGLASWMHAENNFSTLL